MHRSNTVEIQKRKKNNLLNYNKQFSTFFSEKKKQINII